MAGIVKEFGLPFDTVLHGISYANAILYGASVPHYIPKDGKNNGGNSDKYKGTAYGDEVFDPKDKEAMKRFWSTLRD